MTPTTPENTRDYYDQHAGIYDRKTGFGLGGGQEYNFERYYAPLLDTELPETGRVLELGCGTGFYTRWLEERGLDVFAMDISANMVEQARERCPASVSLSVGDCEDPAASLDTEIARSGFDVIVGINTFSYYPNKRSALARYRDLLRPGGRLVMLDMNGWSLTQQLAYLLNYRDARRFRPNVNQSTPARLGALLAATGFEVERMQRFTFVPNEVGPRALPFFGALDKLLARVPFANAFAFRIFWTARSRGAAKEPARPSPVGNR